MKPFTQAAAVIWLGNRLTGRGAISAPNTLKRASYTSGGDRTRQSTNPPELIAAAHAGSFSMTLAKELGEIGYNPHQIATTATVTMEHLAALWTMTQIHLDVIASVPNVAECDFVDAALRARANCPISRSLTANISMRAELSHRNGAVKLASGRRSGARRRPNPNKTARRKSAGK